MSSESARKYYQATIWPVGTRGHGTLSLGKVACADKT